MTGGISIPPCKIQKLDSQSQSEPHVQVQLQEKKLAYLRDTELWDLLPTVTNKRLKAVLEDEGSAAPFLMEMYKELEKPLDSQLKEQILVKEMRLFLESEGRGDLAEEIKSIIHCEMLPLDLRVRFEYKGWHFNTFNDVGGIDDYQLLCLGCRDKTEDPVTDFCNKIGNTLRSDLMFLGFCELIFSDLLWDYTEYMSFQRAMKVKKWYDRFCHMKSLLIPWALNVWTTFTTETRKFDERIVRHCDLWNSVVDEKNKFSEELYEPIRHSLDPEMEREFSSVIKYVQHGLSDEIWMSPDFLIDEYFKKSKPVMRLDNGYPLYLKQKITKAIELGIIKKDDGRDFSGAIDILKKIEDTDLYIWETKKRLGQFFIPPNIFN